MWSGPASMRVAGLTSARRWTWCSFRRHGVSVRRERREELTAGGPEYLSFGADGSPTYPLSAVLPVPGDELFALTAPITPNIAYYLPRNIDVEEVAALARPLDKPENNPESGAERTHEWVEIEEEWVGDKLKAITAYYGSLYEQ